MEKTKITIYHNSSCSKSRSALDNLKQTGQEFEVIEYLKTTPTIDELSQLIQKLNCSPQDLIRKTESVYIEKFKGKDLSDKEWIIAMHENPILIQRPILAHENNAIVARSSDVVQDFLGLVNPVI